MLAKTVFGLILLVTSLGSGLLLGPANQEYSKQQDGKSAPARADQEKQDPKNKPFMKRKLDASREIVAGLATENFDVIVEKAQDMMLLSHESNWNVLQTEAYLQMSRDFRGSAGRLKRAAGEKNLDGATLAYFEMTLNCVRCHKYIRSRIPDNAKPDKSK